MGAFFIYVTWRGKGSEQLPLTYLSAFENDMDMKFKPVVALYILILKMFSKLVLKNDFEISKNMLGALQKYGTHWRRWV